MPTPGRIAKIREALGRAMMGKEAADRMAGAGRASLSEEVERAIEQRVEMAMASRGPSPEEAERIAAYESSPLSFFNVYGAGSYRNAPEKTGVTVNALRQLARKGTIPEVCISTRVNQGAAYSARAEGGKYGVLDRPSWRIRLARGKKPTDQDRANIEALCRFIEKNGWTEPPEAERPLGWEPNFAWTVKTLMRESMTCDWVPTMFWRDTENPGRFPIVAYSPQDAELYRRWVPDVVERNGGLIGMDEPRDADRKSVV